MTLNNLKEALILNNKKLLSRINDMQTVTDEQIDEAVQGTINELNKNEMEDVES